MTLTTLFDREEEGYPASNAFGITHVPSLFLVEPDGTISIASEGFVKADLESIAQRAALPIFRADESVPAVESRLKFEKLSSGREAGKI